MEGLESVTSGIVNGLKGVLQALFVPSGNLGSDLKDKLMEKFPFIQQITDLVSTFLNLGDKVVEPNFTIKAYGVSAKIIDFALIEDYIPIVHTIIIAIAWASFIIKFYKRIPSIIGGYS